MKNKTFTQRDYIKANRRASRLEEIENHNHPINIARVHKSKKVYDRKRNKTEMKKALPYSFFIELVSASLYTSIRSNFTTHVFYMMTYAKE